MRSHSVNHTTLGRTPLNEWSAETSAWQHTTLTKDTHTCPRRDSKPQTQQRAAAYPRLRPWRPQTCHKTIHWQKTEDI